jgi:hypothetical protein
MEGHLFIRVFPGGADHQSLANLKRMIKLFPILGPVFISDDSGFYDFRS